jgi:NAD+ synthase (glutamine-hydrolysing)
MLPQIIQEVTGQFTVPVGCFIIGFNDTSLAYEICEEAWISNNPMIDAALDGAEIFVNVSGSDIERGKLKRKLQMLEEFT